MSAGLATTFQLLKRTENVTAVPLLTGLLDGPDSDLARLALRALLDRPDLTGHRAVFRRLERLDESSQAIVRQRLDRLVGVVAEALRGNDPGDAQAALRTVREFRLYEAMPSLAARLDPAYPLFRPVAETIIELCDSFYAELCAPVGTSPGGDLDGLRRRITSALEEAVNRYRLHHSDEVVEAFLLVAKPQNSILRRILQQPQEAAHAAVLRVLTASPRGGVMRVILGYLDDPQMPLAIRDVLARRDDARFVAALAGYALDRPRKTTTDTLLRVERLEWATPDHPVWDALDEDVAAAALQLVLQTSLPTPRLIDLLGKLLLQGRTALRRVAAAALEPYATPEATLFVLKALHDDDPLVLSHLVRQMRPRGIPGALSLLTRMVDDPREEVRDSLRQALPEFSIGAFLGNFESLPDSLLSVAGHLVRKIDDSAPEHLAGEMQSLSPVRRRRAVLAAAAMGLVRTLEQPIIGLLNDDDHMVRIAAARSLADCDTLPSWEALRDALLDRSVVVQETAESSLARITNSLARQERDTVESYPVLTP